MSSVLPPTTPPRTPPPHASTSALQLTPEQVKRMEINRLKGESRPLPRAHESNGNAAKAKQRQRASEAAASSQRNANNKRPLAVVAATSTSPTMPKPLPRDSRLIGNYVEYDLSKMVNSKGGFLIEDGKEIDEELRRKEMQREKERALQNLEAPVFLESNLNPKCRECGSVDIDHTYKKVFACLVCNKCKNDKPELYSLLTKTECKEDYLLTDPELRDDELLPHLLKANPHKSTWNNMMLFLRYQVEDFAFNKKWGSQEALDKEYEKRVEEKKKKRDKKFEEGLRELRRRNKESLWQRRRDEEHRHEFGVVERREGAEDVMRCTECGFEVAVEEF